MPKLRQTHIKAIAIILTLIIVVLAVIGGFTHYSPVPQGDMWDGYLDFFIRQQNDGGWHVWWAQHNEHRIVLARILFWLDLKWFHGEGWFLIFINYILVAISCFVFYAFVKELGIIEKNKNYSQFLGLLLCCWLFSWSQNENLTWGFQSQFFLAQLLPLCAFFFLYKSTQLPQESVPWLILSCIFGIASLGTMANGVMALPLMFILSLLLRIKWHKSLFIGLLAVTGTIVYFYGYHSLNEHGSLRDTFVENPIDFTRYVLLYLGGPFFYFTENKNIAQIAGGFLILSSVAFAIKSLISREKSNLNLAVLVFILYVGGTSLGTAGGRLVFGLDQALSSRYMTPALMAWAALLILYVPTLLALFNKSKNKNNFLWLLLIIMALLLPQQFKALSANYDVLFERKVAALALEMRINDESHLIPTIPVSKIALKLTEIPVVEGLSVFGLDEIKNAGQLIGQKNETTTNVLCGGNVDRVSRVVGDARYYSISGWLYDENNGRSPNIIHIVSEDGTIVGYGIVGKPRPDVAEAINKNALYSGFKGFLLSSSGGKVIKLIGQNPMCMLKALVPEIPFTIKVWSGDIKKINTDNAAVIAENGWTGTDPDRTTISGLKIYGSFIQADRETGSISIQLERGSKILYRSGPTMGNQLLRINNKDVPILLPAASDWTLMDFSGTQLPPRFLATITDSGTGWGEWSAIALKEQ